MLGRVTSTPSGTRGSYCLAVLAADMYSPFAATDCSQATTSGLWPGYGANIWAVAGLRREHLGCGRVTARTSGLWPGYRANIWAVAGLPREHLSCGRVTARQ